MAKGAFIGIANKARRVKKMYIGISSKARKIKKSYIGINGKARSGGSGTILGQNLIYPVTTNTVLSYPICFNGNALYVGNRDKTIQGYNNNLIKIVGPTFSSIGSTVGCNTKYLLYVGDGKNTIALNTSLVQVNTDLPFSQQNMESVNIGVYVIFVGGSKYQEKWSGSSGIGTFVSTDNNYAFAVNHNLVSTSIKTTYTYFVEQKCTHNSSFAFVGLGIKPVITNSLNIFYYPTSFIQTFTPSLVQSTLQLPNTLYGCASSSTNNYALFAGGSDTTTRNNGASTWYNTVYAINTSLTISTVYLTYARSGNIYGAQINNKAIFYGGYMDRTNFRNDFDIFNSNLTKEYVDNPVVPKSNSNMGINHTTDYVILMLDSKLYAYLF